MSGPQHNGRRFGCLKEQNKVAPAQTPGGVKGRNKHGLHLTGDGRAKLLQASRLRLRVWGSPCWVSTHFQGVITGLQEAGDSEKSTQKRDFQSHEDRG